jgi:cell shape-determining protein MreC
MIKSGNRKNKEIYTVVKVFHGIAETVCNFKHLKNAQQHLKQLKKAQNSDEDDVQIFGNKIID